MEGVTTVRLLQQQEGYELTIRELRNQVGILFNSHGYASVVYMLGVCACV